MNDFLVVMACFGILVIFGGIWATVLDILEDWRDDERRREDARNNSTGYDR